MNLVFLLGDCTAKGGIEKVTITLARVLSGCFSSSIVSLYRSNSKISFCSADLSVDYLKNSYEISMYNRPYKGLLAVLYDFLYIFYKVPSLRKSLKVNQTTVVVSCDIKMTMLALLATVFTPCKVVVIEHFEYDVPNSILKKIRKVLYKYISAVVILTNEDKGKYGWLRESKVQVIPNIVSVEPKTKPIQRKNVVIAVGRMCNQKGFDLLIEAWARIKEKHENWILKIYGEGEKQNLLEQLIFDLKLDNVELLPFTTDIDEVYQEAGMFVLSSRFEGLGMVLIEALAHKLPCVSFDCPAGPKTIIKNGINGTLVPTGNVEKLSEAISDLLSNKALRERYSKNSIESISEFSEIIVAEKWTKLLKEGI